MKKIFAIALALVMVLSMASAFAMNCLTFDLSSTTKCGMGDVKVVTYVKCNDGGTNNSYLANTGAAAVFGENVYYAVKLTVEENPNTSWWDNAKVTTTLTGLSQTGHTIDNVDDKVAATGSLKAGEYYLYWNNTSKSYAAVKAADFVASPDTNGGHLWVASVKNANTAKVCAKLTSELYVPYSSAYGTKGNAIELDGYKVAMNANEKGIKTFSIFFDDTRVDIYDGVLTNVVIGNKVYSGTCAGGFYGKDGNDNITAVSGCGSDYSTINDIFTTFGLSFGMKTIASEDVHNVLGWSTTQEACDNWSAKACAVVDPVAIEIPKTGDASVIAYAVMALVAAAGAMGLKK